MFDQNFEEFLGVFQGDIGLNMLRAGQTIPSIEIILYTYPLSCKMFFSSCRFYSQTEIERSREYARNCM